MPLTSVVFYCEPTGEAPVLGWLASLRKANPQAYANVWQQSSAWQHQDTNFGGRRRTCCETGFTN